MTPLMSGTLMTRLRQLGDVGRADGALTRLAASDADRAGRDLLRHWMTEAGLQVEVDRIGNIHGTWAPEGVDGDPLMIGSHIDTVINAGIFDGCYGVLAGLSIVETLRAEGVTPARPVTVTAFTNEEGVRYAPDMMGSLVYAGGLDVDEAMATVGTDGTTLGAELSRIGYAGTQEPGFLRPHAFIELHIEQGPVLEAEGIALGAVENLQGISWQEITISGIANHAGTTPMDLRRDSGVAAAHVIAGLDRMARDTPGAVATVGMLALKPDAINVIPSCAVFTVDLRNPDETRLQGQEATLDQMLNNLRAQGFDVEARRLARFQPVQFDQDIVARIERIATARGIACRRMTSGAGHDAQMMARIAPSAMIFVPSRDGISHNPAEFTEDTDLIAGAEVLLELTREIIT